MRWDPLQYRRYADERGRPFLELTGRVTAGSPQRVVDLGCGSGELTRSLAARWPDALVRGIDSSPEMIAAASIAAASSPGSGSGPVGFSVGAAEQFSAAGVDVLVSNAVLQWVPTHRELLVRWAGELNPGGWLAFQVPANFGSPSHVLMRELADSPRWRTRLHGVLRGAESTSTPVQYVDLLGDADMDLDAWRTEYVHMLGGEDPVLEWVRGTGLRPVLAALSDTDGAEFSRAYAALLRAAYPARPHGTPFPFLRTFVVARRRD